MDKNEGVILAIIAFIVGIGASYFYYSEQISDLKYSYETKIEEKEDCILALNSQKDDIKNILEPNYDDYDSLYESIGEARQQLGDDPSDCN